MPQWQLDDSLSISQSHSIWRYKAQNVRSLTLPLTRSSLFCSARWAFLALVTAALSVLARWLFLDHCLRWVGTLHTTPCLSAGSPNSLQGAEASGDVFFTQWVLKLASCWCSCQLPLGGLRSVICIPSHSTLAWTRSFFSTHSRLHGASIACLVCQLQQSN